MLYKCNSRLIKINADLQEFIEIYVTASLAYHEPVSANAETDPFDLVLSSYFEFLCF